MIHTTHNSGDGNNFHVNYGSDREGYGSGAYYGLTFMLVATTVYTLKNFPEEGITAPTKLECEPRICQRRISSIPLVEPCEAKDRRKNRNMSPKETLRVRVPNI